MADFGGIEVVFDDGKDLEPQLPGNDDALGTAVAAERDRLCADAVSLEPRDDLGQFGSGLGGGQHLASTRGRHGVEGIRKPYVFRYACTHQDHLVVHRPKHPLGDGVEGTPAGTKPRPPAARCCPPG